MSVMALCWTFFWRMRIGRVSRAGDIVGMCPVSMGGWRLDGAILVNQHETGCLFRDN